VIAMIQTANNYLIVSPFLLIQMIAYAIC
jgi:hypothetical protein